MSGSRDTVCTIDHDHRPIGAESRLCPVWAMLKAGTPITASYRLVAA